MKILHYTSFTSLLLLGLWHGGFYLNYGLPKLWNLSFTQRLGELVSDFGGINGFGLFYILLGAIGVYALWESKKNIAPYYLLFLALFASLYFPAMNLYLNPFVCMFSMYGILRIANMRWELKIVKSFTLLLVICGILFSSISYCNRLVSEGPSSEIRDALILLSSEPEWTVLSHPKNGAWIAAFSKMPVILDSDIGYISNADRKINDTSELYYSRNLQDTMHILDDYRIGYIVIDSDMKKGLVWASDQQGMLFLFRNSKIFKNIHRSQNVEIWKVIR